MDLGNFRIKARGRESYLLALDIMDELADPRCTLVGPEPGNTCTRIYAGHKFICKRLDFGGLTVHEVMPSHSGMTGHSDNSPRSYAPPHGWEGVYE